MRPSPVLAALLLVPALAAADPPSCALPDAAPGCTPVDTAATAGRWAILDTLTGTRARGRSWPVFDGGPIQGLDPRYAYLLQVRVEPPDYDSRLQNYECAEANDLVGRRLVTSCTAPVRPAVDLKAAVGNVAAERIGGALATVGIQSPADMVRMIGLLDARTSGLTLTAAQAADLAAFRTAAIEYVDLVRATEAQLGDWIDAHPGQAPDIGPAVWPPLPVAP